MAETEKSDSEVDDLLNELISDEGHIWPALQGSDVDVWGETTSREEDLAPEIHRATHAEHETETQSQTQDLTAQDLTAQDLTAQDLTACESPTQDRFRYVVPTETKSRPPFSTLLGFGIFAFVLIAFLYFAFNRGGSDVASNDDAPLQPEPTVVSRDEPVATDKPTTTVEAEDATEIDTPSTFENSATDSQGRPLPMLPEQLYPNTPNPQSIPGYPKDPEGVPDDGPYTLLEENRFWLRGRVGSENIRQHLIANNLLAMPEELLVVEYEVDPSSTWYLDDPIPAFLQDDLLFETGSSEVNKAFYPIFQVGVNKLSLDENLQLTVIGHTDSEGSSEFNQELSENRVAAMKDVFIELGANPDQVVVIGMGESEPIADNSTEEGRALNRRVEFLFG